MKTKTLMNAAMMLALYLVFLMLNNLVAMPMLMAIMLPLPIIIFSVMSKRISEILMLFIGCLIGAYFVASLFGVFTTLIYGLSGMALGISLVKERPYWQRLFNGALVYVIGLPLLTRLLTGMNMSTMLSETIQESITMAQALIPTADFTAAAANLNFVLNQSLPTMLLLAGLLSAFLSDKLASFMLKRLKINTIPAPKWENYQLGVVLAVIYMVAQLLYGRLPSAGVNLILINVALILNFLFAVQGFVIVRLFFQSRLKNRLGVVVPLVMLIGGLSMMLSMLGVMDAAFNYRKRFLARTGL